MKREKLNVNHVLMWLRLTETLFQLITQSWRALTGRSADEGFHHTPVSVQLHGLHVLLVKLFDINRNHKHVDGINQLTMTYIHVRCTFNISFGKYVLCTDECIWTGQVSESSLCQIRWVQLCCVITAVTQQTDTALMEKYRMKDTHLRSKRGVC